LQLWIPHTPWPAQLAVPLGTLQGIGVSQAPAAEQVWTELLTHTFVSGLQATHTLPRQAAVLQSASIPQPSPTPQSAAQVPPQSLSVSLPFLMLSMQLKATHLVAEQCPLSGSRQSSLIEQLWFTAHRLVQEPPQSLSVSVPFLTPSLQLAAAHLLSIQRALAGEMQSASPLQALPIVQPPQEPPQSTSVSSPFLALSPQPAARHLPVGASHL